MVLEGTPDALEDYTDVFGNDMDADEDVDPFEDDSSHYTETSFDRAFVVPDQAPDEAPDEASDGGYASEEDPNYEPGEDGSSVSGGSIASAARSSSGRRAELIRAWMHDAGRPPPTRTLDTPQGRITQCFVAGWVDEKHARLVLGLLHQFCDMPNGTGEETRMIQKET